MTKSLIVSFKVLNSRPRSLRAKRAINCLKQELKKHTRLSEEQIVLSGEVNELIWKNGKYGIPRKVSLELYDSKGLTTVYLKGSAELQKKLDAEKKAKKVKEDKAKEKQKEQAEKKEKQEKPTEEDEEKAKKKKDKKTKEMSAEKASFKRGTMKKSGK